MRALEVRFPADAAAALKAGGWYPDRRKLLRAEAWARTLADAGHAVFPAAIEAFAEFGDVTVDVKGPGADVARTSFTVDPLRGLHQPRTVADLGRALELPTCPLGEERDGAALLVLDAAGRVYSLDHAGEWFLGHTVDQAFITLILGFAPERLRPVADTL